MLTRLLLLALALPLAACGSDDAEAGPDQSAVFARAVDAELVVPADKNAMAFSVGEISAPAGATVRLVMDNQATTSRAMIHNVVVLETAAAIDRVGQAAAGVVGNIPEDPAILAYTPLAGPGDRTAVVFTMPPPGRYPFICTYPGHYPFMQGVLVSTAPEGAAPEASGASAEG